MSGYRIYEGHPHFLTMTVVDWIDLFTRKEYCLTVLDSLAYCQEHKGLAVHGYVIMPSHLHLILSAKEGALLSGIIRDFKQFTSRKLTKLIQEIPESRREWLLERFATAATSKLKIKHYQLWQPGNQPKVIQGLPFLKQKLDYIHQNPVKAMIVREPRHFYFSSAYDYAGGKGTIHVELLM